MSCCVFCHTPTKYENGGLTALAPLGKAHQAPRACRECTRDLVASWAREDARNPPREPRAKKGA